MKKLCVGSIAAIILVGLSMVAFVNPDKLITDYSQKAVNLLTAKRSFQGITVEKLSFASAQLRPFDTINWHDVAAEITLDAKNDFFSGKKIKIRMDDVTIILEDFFKHKINFQATGVTVSASSTDQPPSLAEVVRPQSQANVQQFDSLTEGKVSLPLDLNFFNKDEVAVQIKGFIHDFKNLIVFGRSKSPITLTAILSFRVRDENVKALLSVEPEGNDYIVVFNKESLRVVSWLFEEEITNPEVALLARNPFLAPQLLRIRDEAESVSQEAHAKNTLVPEDAYRHILWSYLLTKEYGPEFAQKVTDAHELGVTDNTEADHRMDFTNNRVGRQYALREFRKGEILSHLFRDSEVIKQAK